ncbi:hypothetical protein MTR67_038814 [Solanum verrucosum]|uniref:Ubiquitin-like protease family profile domain-containing protein n=1 Tax=Solanum verrucosum TaxID=315347 RepID=A0AAF0UGI4_SOLVR|nr:hypothetical protein MTR67_038814 [Solanum verrucosum]
MNQYRYTTANYLFISHIKNTYERYYLANDDDLISTQEHIDRASAVSVYESGFFEKTEQTNFVDCDAYKDNNPGSLLEAQVPFIVEFSQDIMQQKSDNLDCGLYVATFAEYLSDQIETSLVDFLPEYLRKRYGALLWSYDSEKAKGAYVSENDDPPKPKSVFWFT